MSIFGVDISRYQRPEAMDGYGFVILNVKDPGFATKAWRAIEHGIPWDVYYYLNDEGRRGEHGGDAFREAKYLVDIQHFPGREPGFWLDYEEVGSEPHQAHEWFAAADHAGVQSGFYTYLHVLNREGNPVPERPLWIAYYPGSNNGSYPASQVGDALRWGAEIWQYTSTNSTLDINIILDEQWWNDWIGDDMGLTAEDKEWITRAIADAFNDRAGWWQDRDTNINAHTDQEVRKVIDMLGGEELREARDE